VLNGNDFGQEVLRDMEVDTEAGVGKVGWSLAEISEAVGLSLGFLRGEVRSGRLPVRHFGRRVVVLNQDLQRYLKKGSPSGEREAA